MISLNSVRNGIDMISKELLVPMEAHNPLQSEILAMAMKD